MAGVTPKLKSATAIILDCELIFLLLFLSPHAFFLVGFPSRLGIHYGIKHGIVKGFELGRCSLFLLLHLTLRCFIDVHIYVLASLFFFG